MATIRIKNNNNEWESVAIANTKASVEPMVLTGDCDYSCAGAIASKYIEKYGNTVSTKDINKANYMFYKYQNESIPFDLNFTTSLIEAKISSCFFGATNLKQLPKILNLIVNEMSFLFYGCENLREIPEDYFDTWDFSKMSSSTAAYLYSAGGLFKSCYSLRKVPLAWLKNMNPVINYSNTYFASGFSDCFVLDELANLPIPYTATYTYNFLNYTFANCHRLKHLTFEINEDGAPKVVQWKKQTMDLSNFVGWSGYKSDIFNFNSGITADKEVKDDATYQALKNDPDWFTTNIAYSRYNHDSAVATINSLPDTSAYLATAGGTNTIMFKGASGSLTDGGAINTLTEEEIAVAVAKGWTVSFV